MIASSHFKQTGQFQIYLLIISRFTPSNRCLGTSVAVIEERITRVNRERRTQIFSFFLIRGWELYLISSLPLEWDLKCYCCHTHPTFYTDLVGGCVEQRSSCRHFSKFCRLSTRDPKHTECKTKWRRKKFLTVIITHSIFFAYNGILFPPALVVGIGGKHRKSTKKKAFWSSVVVNSDVLGC